MMTEQYVDVIKACRFCFMCRHLATVGNVTFREADTPRGTALLIDKMTRDPSLLGNADYVEAIYRNTLSAACRKHCVSSYDEAGLVQTAREEIVAAGFAPVRVKELVAVIERCGDPFGLGTGAARIEAQGTGKAEILYFVDPYTEHKRPEIAAAFLKLAAKLGVAVKTLRGLDTGKAMLALGFRDKAIRAAEKLRDAVLKSGCKAVVASCPATVDAFIHDYPKMGCALGEGVEASHSSQFILRLLKDRKASKKPKGGKRAVYMIDSDYLRNYLGIADVPRALMSHVGLDVRNFGTNTEESYACGEGTVVYDLLNPGLVPLLRERVVEMADDPANDVLVVSSPYTKHVLSVGEHPLQVATVEEVVAEQIL